MIASLAAGEPPRDLLRAMFDAAVRVALPAQVLPAHLPPPPPPPPQGRTIVAGAGKASAAMARALEDAWPGPLTGLVVTRHGHSVPCRRIEVVEAAHPVPDAACAHAARRMLELVSGLSENDLVLALISGGGSALMALPAPGITFSDKQEVNRALLHCGASIGEINCVRKHLSAIKGGRLAAQAFPAEVVSLLISDVPGDDPAVIASGPTTADPTTAAEALAVLRRYPITVPASVIAHLERGSDETPKPGDPRLVRATSRIIAAPQQSLEAAAAVARAAGITPLILSDCIEGEAREVAKVMAGIAQQVVRHGQPVARPCVLLSGGETTVTVGGQGQGGRNVEFLLALAIALSGASGIAAIACDTDGIDGGRETAGAVITPDTLARAAVLGLDPRASLANNDAHTLFEALGDAVVTGPTLTNVNDFRAVLIV